MYRGAVGIDALNERLQARLNRDGKPALGRPLPDRRPPDPDPQLARAGPDERLDRLPPRRRPRRRGDRRRHRRGRHADDPLRRDGDAAARLRDLGPQGPGLRGARGGRRLPPLPLADADPTAALHGDHPRPQQLRAGRRPGGAGGGGRARRQRRPPLRPAASACATELPDLACREPAHAATAAPQPPRYCGGEGGDASHACRWRRSGVTLAGIALLAVLVLAVPALRDAFSAAIHGDHAEVRDADRQPRRLGAAADPRPHPDPLRRLLPGGDRRRGRRLRLRLLPRPRRW